MQKWQCPIHIRSQPRLLKYELDKNSYNFENGLFSIMWFLYKRDFSIFLQGNT